MTGTWQRKGAAASGESGDDRWVAAAAHALDVGEVVALPTDTVYGLAARIDRPASIARLYAIKSRPTSKAIPVLLSALSHINQVTDQLPPEAARLARIFWPGALTMVVNARDGLPLPVTSVGDDGQRTVAVRVPDDELARRIIDAAGGALAVTSANISGEHPATTADHVEATIGEKLGLIIDGGPARGGVPSTIVDVTGRTVEILRAGTISADAIGEALGRPATNRGQDRPGAV